MAVLCTRAGITAHRRLCRLRIPRRGQHDPWRGRFQRDGGQVAGYDVNALDRVVRHFNAHVLGRLEEMLVDVVLGQPPLNAQDRHLVGAVVGEVKGVTSVQGEVLGRLEMVQGVVFRNQHTGGGRRLRGYDDSGVHLGVQQGGVPPYHLQDVACAVADQPRSLDRALSPISDSRCQT